ncbi:MAG: hypothetical protein CMG63_00455 [Candidatus Marinimicrobia bacterium]|nr:hypothetical protein [Candidatus Neomarinimicrobiota bacterium]
MQKQLIFILIFFSAKLVYSQCDSTSTYFSQLPNSLTILVGDTCLSNADIAVLDSIISKNNLDYESPLAIGTQTWFDGRLRFFVAGNYGNSSGMNDTIYTLPENFGNLTGLTTLYLEWHRISELPESFSNLSNLMSLYINNNILTSMGDNIGNLTNLYFLDLGYNELSEVPASICNLENLTYLWLFNNNLENLPDCFCDLDLDWLNDDNSGYPFFAIGANQLCDNIASCIDSTEHLTLSLDQFYYSFPVYSPQDCDTTTATLEDPIFPYQFQVSSPYPNPFNPTVHLEMYVPHDRKMDIRVFDILGNETNVISNYSIYEFGSHKIHWSSENHSSGVYYIRFSDGIHSKVKKLMVIK